MALEVWSAAAAALQVSSSCVSTWSSAKFCVDKVKALMMKEMLFKNCPYLPNE